MKGNNMAIQHATVSSEVRGKGTKKGPLTITEAKALIGWLPESEGPKKGFGKDYALKDMDGNKVRLTNNTTNRPFRMTLAKRYANEILRGKWRLNGEPLIFDRHGKVQSGQHRLVGFILAEQTRLKAVEQWKETGGWKGPVTMDVVITVGISEKAETVDTLDLGQKRTLGDVVFRNNDFADQSERDAKKLSNMLAGATRLAWLRSGGLSVSDAPHFPHSEALDFIADHPGLKESTVFIHNENGGSGADGNLISGFLSLGYAAGLHYLMTVSGTDPDAYHDQGVSAIDTSMKDKADDFWVNFAQGAELKKGSPILSLRNVLPKIDSSGAMGRDEIIGTVIKAFNLWVDNKEAKSAKDVKVKRTRDGDGKIVLGEEPRLGGIDSEVEVINDDDDAADADANEAPAEAPSRGSKSKGGWTEGDTAWVKDEDGDDWFGTIKEVFDTDDDPPVRMAMLTAMEDGKEYEALLTDLVVGRPVRK